MEYAANDHIALTHDLRLIAARGWNIISVSQLVDAHATKRLEKLPHPCLALTCDDGSWLDWYDIEHPKFGKQRSFRNILRDFVRDNPEYSDHSGLLTSFVIVSPNARDSLDRNCLIGKGWWTDEWWADARNEGLLSIQNHSWDHKHPGVDEALRFGERYGSFEDIRDFDECRWQIDQGQDYLNKILGAGKARYFAYPYGHTPALVADEYLPMHAEACGLKAAFTTEPAPVTADSDRWRLPRYVFRRDWFSPDALRELLDDLA